MQSNPQSNPVFLEWISNPGAIHQKGMQSGFCNPAITILPMPDHQTWPDTSPDVQQISQDGGGLAGHWVALDDFCMCYLDCVMTTPQRAEAMLQENGCIGPVDMAIGRRRHRRMEGCLCEFRDSIWQSLTVRPLLRHIRCISSRCHSTSIYSVSHHHRHLQHHFDVKQIQ